MSITQNLEKLDLEKLYESFDIQLPMLSSEKVYLIELELQKKIFATFLVFGIILVVVGWLI